MRTLKGKLREPDRRWGSLKKVSKPEMTFLPSYPKVLILLTLVSMNINLSTVTWKHPL